MYKEDYEYKKIARIANKSIGSGKRIKKNFSKINKVRLTAVVIATTLFVTASLSFTNLGLEKVSEQLYLHQEKKVYEEAFNANSYRLLNGNQFYKNDKNAEAIWNRLNEMGIYEDQDINLELYKMYSLMRNSANRNELTNMNEVVQMLKFFYSEDNAKIASLPESFTDLIKESGFLKEDGSLDINAYEDAMDELLLINSKDMEKKR